MWFLYVGLFIWKDPSKGDAVVVAVVISATTLLEEGLEVTHVTFNGFYVGTFPSAYCKKGNTKCKVQSREQKYEMLFNDETETKLVMNQGKKKQALFLMVVTCYPI